ncbi:VCBS repeat-containing protein [Flavobacteriaceae bacterium]|nr:VCBS repeat-containing protein [Flavobacteriaceae bacterium]
MKFKSINSIFTLFIILGCNLYSEPKKLFTELSPSVTQLYFQNDLIEGHNSNVLLYEYFYNGGGVALADFNGDALLDLYATSNMGENKMYLNKGGFRFEDITQISNTSGRKGAWSSGVTAVDINGDGRMDLYVCYSGNLKQEKRKNQLFLNMGNNADGIPVYTEAAGLFGLDSPAFSNQGYFFDYDKDGDLDMLLLNHNPESLPILSVEKSKTILEEDSSLSGLRLYEQRNRYFYDITRSSGINGSSLSYGLGIALSDFNNDGWTDFYISNDYTIPDYLYINNTNGGFEDRLKESMPHISHFSMGNDAGDYNNDGWIDLLTLDMLPEDNKRQKLLKAPDNYNLFNLNIKSGFHNQFMRNMLQKNNGNGTFSEIGQMMGISNTDWSWSALFADYDNDGWQDLFISNGYKRDFTNRDFLNYMESYIGAKNSKLKKTDVLKMINKMPASNVSNYIYANKSGNGFEDKTITWGISAARNSNGAAYGDLDNDGDLDLVINNINAPIGVYQNNADYEKGFVQIVLKGEKPNVDGIGAKVYVYAKGLQMIKEQFLARGYLSSVSPVLHFGLGDITIIDSLVVNWNDGNISKKFNFKGDQILTIEQSESEEKVNIKFDLKKTLFNENSSSITYSNELNNTLDFDRQKLLHYQPSFEGPPMIKGDINADGLMDVIIGGGKDQATEIWVQDVNNSFSKLDEKVFELDKNSINTSLTLFDMEGDGDLDLYVANGGYHQLDSDSSDLQDVLYINFGNGHFIKSNKNYERISSTSVVAAHDYNQDGFLDLFLGGGIVPGSYPLSGNNCLLLNDGKGGFFLDKTNSILLNEMDGIVRDALWSDVDGDNEKDLIVVGEWMPINVFIVKDSLMKKQTDFFDHPKTKEGWWNCIISSDINNDGKPDFIIGNEGLNNSYNASINTPLELHFDDFDMNGSIDPILSHYINNSSYPIATRDELLSQWVGLKSAYPSYASFSNVDMSMLLKEHQLTTLKTWKAGALESIAIISSDSIYSVKALPKEVQISPVKAIHIEDLNDDGKVDLILAGNRSKMALKIGNQDASFGCVLFGNGNGDFMSIDQASTGLKINGDVSSILEINSKYYFARIQDTLAVYEINTEFD